jgi:hypothetical protein
MSTRAVASTDIRLGMEIPPLTKTAYQRALDELSFSGDSIHNDAYTRRQGYGGALMSAYVLCGYMSELMVNFFGHHWMRGSRISLTFINGGVQQGDRITCRGRVTAATEYEDGLRVKAEIWMEKGEPSKKVVVGAASAVIRSQVSLLKT